MKKWVRDYENNKIPTLINSSDLIQIDSSLKIGILVSTALDKVIKNKNKNNKQTSCKQL